MPTFPVEVHTEIAQYLPRKDLHSLVLVSKLLHDVAIPLLHKHVYLKSLDQVEAFFFVKHMLPEGTVDTEDYATTRGEEWAYVKTLEIELHPSDAGRTIGSLPTSLAGPDAKPLEVDLLRLSYPDHCTSIHPLLRCINPTGLELSIVADNITKDSPDPLPPINLSTQIKTVDLAFHRSLDLDKTREVVELLDRDCPSLEHVNIDPWAYSPSDLDKVVDTMVKKEFLGRPEGFVSIVESEDDALPISCASESGSGSASEKSALEVLIGR